MLHNLLLSRWLANVRSSYIFKASLKDIESVKEKLLLCHKEDKYPIFKWPILSDDKLLKKKKKRFTCFYSASVFARSQNTA